MVENEWLPQALTLGISYNDFWHMNPRIIKIHLKAQKIKEQMIDEKLWRMGLYVESAVATAVEHNLAGRKAKSQYVKKPFLQEAQISEKKELTEERKAEMENQKLAMTLRIMQANYEISKSARGQ